MADFAFDPFALVRSVAEIFANAMAAPKPPPAVGPAPPRAANPWRLDGAPPAAEVTGAAAQVGDAIAGPATDTEAVGVALDGRTPEELAAIRAEYARQSGGESLDGALRSELAPGRADAMVDAAPRDAAKQRAEADAQAFAKAATDPDAYRRLFAGKSPEQIGAMREVWERQNPGKDFHQSVHEAQARMDITDPRIAKALEQDHAEVIDEARERLAPANATPQYYLDEMRKLTPAQRDEAIALLPEEERQKLQLLEHIVKVEDMTLELSRDQLLKSGAGAGAERLGDIVRGVPESRREQFLASLNDEQRASAEKGYQKLADEKELIGNNIAAAEDSARRHVGEPDWIPKGLFHGVPRDRWDAVIEEAPEWMREAAAKEKERVLAEQKKDASVLQGTMALVEAARGGGEIDPKILAASIELIPFDRREEARNALAEMDPTGNAQALAEAAWAERQRKLAGAAADLFGATVSESGTDEKTIRKTLLGLSPGEVAELAQVYQEANPGHTLEGDLLGDLTDDDEKLDAEMVKAKLAGDEVGVKALAIEIGADDDEGLMFQVLESTAADPAMMAAVEERIAARRAGDDEIDEDDKSFHALLEGELGDEALERAEALRSGDLATAYAIQAETAMEGGGTDEEGVNAAAAHCPIELRAKMAEVYAARNDGQSLLGAIQEEIEDPAEENIAVGLFLGQQDRVLAGQMKKDGIDSVMSSCKGKTAAELAAAEARFNKDYPGDEEEEEEEEAEGGQRRTAFQRYLEDEADDEVELAAARQIAEKGRLDPELAVLYAGNGMGTLEEEMKAALRDPETGQPLPKGELERVRQRFPELAAKLGVDVKSLDEYVASELGGRDAFDARWDLQGAPTSPEEKVARVKATHEFERSGFLSGVTDTLFASEESDVETYQAQRLEQIARNLESGGGSPEQRREWQQELDRRYGYYAGNVAAYREGKDTASNIVVGGTTAVVGAVTTALSGGSLGPAWAAVLGSMAGGAAGLNAKIGMQGAGVSESELAGDLFQTMASAATAGLFKLEGVGKFFQSLLKSGIGKEGALKMLEAMANSSLGLFTNDQLTDGKLDIGDALTKVLGSGAVGLVQGLSGEALSKVLNFVGLSLAQVGDEGAERLKHVLNKALSGVGGDMLSTLADPEMWKAKFGGAWLQKMLTSGVTQMIGAYGSWEEFENANRQLAHQLGIPESEMWNPEHQVKITELHKDKAAAEALGIRESEMDTPENRKRIEEHRAGETRAAGRAAKEKREAREAEAETERERRQREILERLREQAGAEGLA